MHRRRLAVVTVLLAIALLGLAPGYRAQAAPAGPLVTPEKFLGFPVGADNKLARWDKIVDYMQLVPRPHRPAFR